LWSTLSEQCHIDEKDRYLRTCIERERERERETETETEREKLYSYGIGEGPISKTSTEMRTTQLFSAERYARSKLKF